MSCGSVVAIPKRMPNLGAETRALYIQKLHIHGGTEFKFCRFYEGGPLPWPLACSTPLPVKATKLRSCTSVCVLEYSCRNRWCSKVGVPSQKDAAASF